MTREIVLGIDASRNRSGGAKAHVIGILTESDPPSFGISEVHLWACRGLLNAVPDRPWLRKRCPPALDRSLPSQLIWQARELQREAKVSGCDILFTTDASTLCRFRPMVVMSQDLLSFQPEMISTYGLSMARLRLEALLYIQKWAMQRADGVIFLTRFAAETVTQSTGTLGRMTLIPHGVGPAFAGLALDLKRSLKGTDTIRCLYISNAEIYKHHPEVIRAVAKLRSAGLNVDLTLVGGGRGRGLTRLSDAIARADPDRSFIKTHDFVPQAALPGFMAETDIFIFASACENLPVTLLEAMAAGLPIACSDCGPMPEVLRDAGVYFDPKNPDAIASAIMSIINDDVRRLAIAARAKEFSREYTWRKCGEATWKFVIGTYRHIAGMKHTVRSDAKR